MITYINSKDTPKRTLNHGANHLTFKITDNPTSDVNTSNPGSTKFHCVFSWKLGDTDLMHFSGVQGVDSDAEIIADTDLSKIKVARIKTRFSRDDERNLALYKSPFWWSQCFLLGTAEIHVVNINEDDVIENINTLGLDTFLHDNEVSSFRNIFRLKCRAFLSF